ncbi:MAG TPA: tryptophan synthase subunit alpha, partial [Acetobacteraceae bacterium]|nr:tryptophan synthase subunit alpha [Acetobacteraceae bacterium]
VTALPIAIGFGVRSPAQAAEAVRVADAAVVGSALCSTIEANLGQPDLVRKVLDQVRELADGVRGARVPA